MSQENKAIWIDSNNELSLRVITDTYHPTGTQLLVRVKYSGINPADIKHGSLLGLNNYPSGYEYSGEVIETGPAAKYAVGDLICGHNHAGKWKPIYHGAHQDIMIAEHAIFKIPSSVPLQAAACMSIAVSTAADALFNQLDLPNGKLSGQAHGQETPSSSLLVWGGSSGVGIAAIQLAKAAGISPILTTASKHNHEVLRLIGASACFDYRDEDVSSQIKSWLKENRSPPLAAIFDTVCSRGPTASTDLCEQSAENEQVRFACTLPQLGKQKWKMVLATRDVGFPMPKLGGGVVMVTPNEVWQERIESAMEWPLSHYGKGNGFYMPKVTVVNGAEKGMEVIKSVVEGKSSLEKFAIQHPL